MLGTKSNAVTCFFLGKQRMKIHLFALLPSTYYFLLSSKYLSTLLPPFYRKSKRPKVLFFYQIAKNRIKKKKKRLERGRNEKSVYVCVCICVVRQEAKTYVHVNGAGRVSRIGGRESRRYVRRPVRRCGHDSSRSISS